MVEPEWIQQIIARILEESGNTENVDKTGLSTDHLIHQVSDRLMRYQACTLKKQLDIIQSIRSCWSAHLDYLTEFACQIDHGIARDKKRLMAHLLDESPDIRHMDSKSITGDHGMTLIDYSAYGVFLIALPRQHSIETLISHVIAVLSAGNAAIFVCDPVHFIPVKAVLSLLDELLDVHQLKGLLSLVSLTESRWCELSDHSGVHAVISDNADLLSRSHTLINKKFFISRKRPVPVIVDQTADLKRAAINIMQGAQFDHNLLYCAEKFVIIAEEAYDYFEHTLCIEGGQWHDMLKERILDRDFKPEAFYGCSLNTLLEALLLPPVKNKNIGLIELTEEELSCQSYSQYCGLPLLFVLKVRDVEKAIEIARKIDQNAHFIAIMHSKNIDHLSLCARKMQTAIFIKNAPSYAALGIEGEGFPSMFCANITGEGPLHPKDFARKRRCILAEGFFIR